MPDTRQAPGLQQRQDREAVCARGPGAEWGQGAERDPGREWGRGREPGRGAERPNSSQAWSSGASSRKCEPPEKEPGLRGEGRAGRGLRVSIRPSTYTNTEGVGESQDRTQLL